MKIIYHLKLSRKISHLEKTLLTLSILFTLCSCFSSSPKYLTFQKGSKALTYDLNFPRTDLSKVKTIYEKRFALAGLKDYSLEDLAENHLRIKINGLKDPELILPLIQKQGLLTLRFVQKEHPIYQEALKNFGIENLNQKLSLTDWKKIQALQNIDPKVSILRQEIKPELYQFFLVENQIQLDHSAIQEVSPYPKRSSISFFPQPPLRGILITLNEASKSYFAKITRENIGDELAFIIDEEVIQVPRIMEEIKEGQVMLDYGQAGLSKDLDYMVGLNALLIQAPLEQSPQILKVMQEP